MQRTLMVSPERWLPLSLTISKLNWLRTRKLARTRQSRKADFFKMREPLRLVERKVTYRKKGLKAGKIKIKMKMKRQSWRKRCQVAE